MAARNALVMIGGAVQEMPAGDTLNGAGGAGVTREQRSTNTALAQADSGKVIGITAAITQTIAAQSTLTAGWNVELRNEFNGDFTIDPNGSELIDGASTLVVKAGWAFKLNWDGTKLRTSVLKRRTFSLADLAQVTANTTLIIPPDTYVLRGYGFGQGSNAVNGTRNGAGGGCAYGDIAVNPGDSLVIAFSSGVCTVTLGATAMLTANGTTNATGGTASKHASVANGGAYSGGAATNATDSLGGSSSGSPVGTGVQNTAGKAGGAGWGGIGDTGGGGGTGGAGSTYRPGRSISSTTRSTEPLLSLLDGTPGMRTSNFDGGDGGNGAGGGSTSGSGITAGRGGIGSGGGANTNGIGGAGGLGGGGGIGSTSANTGAAGYGAGGALAADGSNTNGGAPVFFYFKEPA